MVRASWIYVKYLVFQHQPDQRGSENSSLVRFMFPRGNLDAEVASHLPGNGSGGVL